MRPPASANSLERVIGRQPVLGARSRWLLFASVEESRVRRPCALRTRRLIGGSKARSNPPRASRVEKLKAARPSDRGRLRSVLPAAVGIAEVPMRTPPASLGHQLLKQLDPLRVQLRDTGRQARDVPARPSEACDEAVPTGSPTPVHDDRGSFRRMLGRQHRWRAARDDDIHLAAGPVRRQLGNRSRCPSADRYSMTSSVPRPIRARAALAGMPRRWRSRRCEVASMPMR